MKIQEKSVVTMHYTLTTDQGDTIDSSVSGEPLSFIQGVGMLIPGLEAQLDGKEIGFKALIKVDAKEAYGDRNEEAMHTLPKSGFQPEKDEELVIGMEVQLDSEQGPVLAFVTEIKEEEVVLDLNHPLAGMNLNFDVEVIAVRAAEKEELEHRNAH
ncbi:MAG: peptidylprolyl isomerase [Flavobacteriales bacterium]|nr:peptidylprolyl isomerase [Flavobacteriales bacterium]